MVATNFSNSQFNSALHFAFACGINASSVNETLEEWQLASNHSTDELVEYAVYFYWQQLCHLRLKLFENVVNTTLSIFGLVGSLIEILVLRAGEFKTPSFLYHKLIACIGLLLSVVNLAWEVFWFIVPNGDDRGYANTFLMAILNDFCAASDWLTLFVSIERMVALLLPHRFPEINQSKVVVAAALLSFTYACSYGVDVFSPLLSENGAYDQFVNSLATVDLCVALLLTTFSTAVIVGLIRTSRHQQVRTYNEREARRKAKLNRQLAYLSLSCALPILLNTALTQSENCFCADSKTAPCAVGTAALSDWSVGVAKSFAANNVLYNVLGMLNNVSWTSIFATHFYFYLLLSPRFKNATVRLFGGQPIGTSRVGDASTAPVNHNRALSTISMTANQNRGDLSIYQAADLSIALPISRSPSPMPPTVTPQPYSTIRRVSVLSLAEELPGAANIEHRRMTLTSLASNIINNKMVIELHRSPGL